MLDDVGNQGTVQTYPIRMELMTTDPSAGFFDVATGVQLTPPPEAFIDRTFSEAFIHLCRYTILGGYECAANLSTFSSAASQRAALDTDSPYTFGGEAANNEVINLPGSAGVTTVYDLKILNDSLNLDSVTDVDHQALFVIDLDVPQALVFPDPDPTTDDSMFVQATGYDAGYFTVLASSITNLDTERVVGNKSSDDLAVGAPGYTVGTDADAGRVYLYRGVDGTGLNTTAFWSEANPNTSGRLGPRAGERFGHSLLVGQMNDTDTHEVAIGASGGTSLSDSSYTGKGSVYYLEVNLLNGEEHLGRGKGQVVRPQTQHPLQVMAGIGERSISTDS